MACKLSLFLVVLLLHENFKAELVFYIWRTGTLSCIYKHRTAKILEWKNRNQKRNSERKVLSYQWNSTTYCIRLYRV